MSHELKRTFIPPENRPQIRGAALRNGAFSQHYLAIFNHFMRRKVFLRDLEDGKLPDVEKIFGMPPHQLRQLLQNIKGQP